MFESTASTSILDSRPRQNIHSITTKAMTTLLPFPTSCLREAGFSAVTATKTKWWSRLNTLRATLSPVTPGWDRLVAEKQAERSHWFSVNSGWYFYALCVCYHARCILFYFHVTLWNTLHTEFLPPRPFLPILQMLHEKMFFSLCEKNTLFVFVMYVSDFTQSSGSEIQSCSSLETRVDTRFNAKCELTGLQAVRLWSDHSRRMLMSGLSSPHSVTVGEAPFWVVFFLLKQGFS